MSQIYLFKMKEETRYHCPVKAIKGGRKEVLWNPPQTFHYLDSFQDESHKDRFQYDLEPSLDTLREIW